MLVLSVVVIGLIVFLFCYNDEIVHTIKKYYPDSKETLTFDYIIRNGDTINNGKSIIYNEKGIKTSECNFVNNVLKGKRIHYYDNGKIESIEYNLDNKRKAEILWNYTNEKVKEYALYNPAGELTFNIKFNQDGTVAEYKGYPSIEIYQYKFANKERFNIKENQHLKVGDTLRYQYLVANIPNAKRSFSIENISIDNSKVKRIIKTTPPTGIDVKEVLTTKGKNTIRAIVKYQFNDKITPVLKDTTNFEVNVH